MGKVDYRSAGVNIEAGNEVVERIRSAVARTHSPAVLSGIGSFGSFFDLTEVLRDYRQPVLVQSIDGVGTKVTVARMAGAFTNLGIDVVSAAVNDIIVHGARPLTFLDYIANERLDPDVVAEIVTAMAGNCAENGIALVGGETAEMPSTYQPGEHDLVGCVTGVVERDSVINGSTIQTGDLLLGIGSTGLHTNGFSLARKVFFEIAKLGINDPIPSTDAPVGETLLTPHRNYCRPVFALLESGCAVRGMAHITGGGLMENLPRILPENNRAKVDTTTWSRQPVFEAMQQIGEIDTLEMYRAFNMGIGMVVVVPADEAESARATLTAHSEDPVHIIGHIEAGPRGVELIA